MYSSIIWRSAAGLNEKRRMGMSALTYCVLVGIAITAEQFPIDEFSIAVDPTEVCKVRNAAPTVSSFLVRSGDLVCRSS